MATTAPGVRVLASSAATGGVCSIVELELSADAVLPPHTHGGEDQVLIVLAGSLAVTVGDHRAEVRAGGVAFCPKGVVHGVAVASTSARVLAVQIPGGLEPLLAARAVPGLDAELLLSLAVEHDVRIALPPLEPHVHTVHRTTLEPRRSTP